MISCNVEKSLFNSYARPFFCAPTRAPFKYIPLPRKIYHRHVLIKLSRLPGKCHGVRFNSEFSKDNNDYLFSSFFLSRSSLVGKRDRGIIRIIERSRRQLYRVIKFAGFTSGIFLLTLEHLVKNRTDILDI